MVPLPFVSSTIFENSSGINLLHSRMQNICGHGLVWDRTDLKAFDWNVNVWHLGIKNWRYFYRPRPKYDGKVVCSICLSVHPEGGYPSIWFQVPSLPRVPGPFWGTGGRGYPSIWSQVLSQGRGYPSQVLDQGCPLTLPSPTPSQDQGGGRGRGGEGEEVPQSGPRLAVPPPPPPRQHMLWTRYPVGGTPLAVTQEDFLVSPFLLKNKCQLFWGTTEGPDNCWHLHTDKHLLWRDATKKKLVHWIKRKRFMSIPNEKFAIS